jgi:DNA-binding NarL/FixJ family response regulator
MIRLVIADDHAIVRSGLKQIFALMPQLQVAGEAVNGAEVMTCLRDLGFDLLLLDLNMPGISGADLIARVKAHRPDLPILVLSMHDQPQVAASVLKAGANGYVTKDCDSDVLLTAILQVARGQSYIAPQLAAQMVFAAATSVPAEPHHLLSQREQEVMRLLVKGLSVNEIGQTLSISNKTVSTHKARLMDKMNLTSVAELVRYALLHNLPV